MITTLVNCPACKHQDNVENDTGLDDQPFILSSVFRCSECGARMAHGRLMPRVVVEPYTDSNGYTFTRVRIQDAVTKEDMHRFDVDPQYGHDIARDLNFLAGAT